ncbi:MAG: DUF4349 domain-containing protein [Paludibacteraceae bacterium]|nr:DUF4349 domain-containing protein [Paludibacteraceae bacterium]MBP5480245.1 DUF4349 domain-containing protein [Paludibacteraceae bacterium]
MKKCIYLVSLFLLGVFAQGCSGDNEQAMELSAPESYSESESYSGEPSASANDEEENIDGGGANHYRVSRSENADTKSCEMETSSSEDKNYSVDYSKNIPVGRKMEKKARLCIETPDITQCRKYTDSLSSRYGAYVEKEQYTSSLKAYTIKLRVPSIALDSFLSGMHGINGTITDKIVSVTDRTSDYRDYESQRKTQNAMLERYRTMLKSASNISDILEIQNRIDQIQMETDRVQGRMNVIDQNVSYSVVNISIKQERKKEPVQTVEEEKPSFWKDLGEAFCWGWSIIKAIVLGIIALWPLWIIAGVIVYIWRKKRKNKPAQPQKPLSF